MSTNQISKTTLAKLLATENINVEYRGTHTAAFNVESRTLVLPIWNDMTPEMHDLLIGHEVGHALDTPTEYGNKELQNYGKGFKTFLNVVEDARVERRIKNRYPGLKRQFSKGYQEFFNRDFFKIKGKNLAKMLLIDRINLHYKIGPFLSINFNEVETQFIRKIDEVENFDDVIAICKELYDYCKQELEENRKEQIEDFKQKLAEEEDFGDDEDHDEDVDYGDDDYGDDFEDLDGASGESHHENEENETDADENDDENGNGHSHGTSRFESDYSDSRQLKDYDEPKSITDENLEKSLRQMTEQKEILIGNAPNTSDWDYDSLIVNYKDLLGEVFDPCFREIDKNALTNFETRTKNAILYLVKEFELRKKAAEARRVVVSDTGVLDTNKLHTYKFNDDIFRKVGTVTAGKNHGIVIFVDWSGSVSDNLLGTIEQLITLTTFCRKVNVPYDVYAFTDQYCKSVRLDSVRNLTIKEKTLDIDDKFTLMNFLSSKMRNQEYRRMANDLLNYAKYMKNYYIWDYIMPNMRLGGTPLNATILASSGIVNRFRKAYRAEIVDVVFLTDGNDSSTLYTKSENYYDVVRIGPSNSREVSYIEDKENNKRYRVESHGVTPVLLQMLKDRTGCNLIGFFITLKGSRAFESIFQRMEISGINWAESYAKFKKEKHFTITNYGYDRYFLIPGGSELSVDDDDLDDLLGKNTKEVSTRRLKGAFVKMNQNRLTNRILLTKIIEGLA